MTVLFCLLFGFLSITHSTPYYGTANRELDNNWEEYKAAFEKKYEGVEDLSRRLIWETNVQKIKDHNAKFDSGEHSYSLQTNRFSDMAMEEIMKPPVMKMRVKYNRTSTRRELWHKKKLTLPESIDWRASGCVSEPLSEGNCNAGWASAAAGAIEGQYCLQYHHLYSFSVQELIDCTSFKSPYANGNGGCFNGMVENAFEYVIHWGMSSNTSYPYKGKVGKCNHHGGNTLINRYGQTDEGNEDQMKSIVGIVGPMATYVHATTNFLHYKGGIFSDVNCDPVFANFGVLIVGYGNDNGTDFWTGRASLGSKWGEDGYFRIVRNDDNHCGIANWASIPLY